MAGTTKKFEQKNIMKFELNLEIKPVIWDLHMEMADFDIGVKTGKFHQPLHVGCKYCVTIPANKQQALLITEIECFSIRLHNKQLPSVPKFET